MKNWFLAGLNPGHWSGEVVFFWLNSVFWHINAFSGVSLTSPGLQTTDFKLRGRPTSDWQKARQRALLYECGPYPVGSWKTDAGRTAERQSGVRWDKHSLMSRACQGLSHDYTRVEGRVWGLGSGWEHQEALPAAASDGTITECRKSKFKTD